MDFIARDTASVEEIGQILWEAGIQGPFTYDEARQALSVPIFRTGYEYRRRRIASVFPFFFKWVMPTVPAVVEISPCQVLSDDASDLGWSEHDNILSFRPVSPSRLEIETVEAELVLRTEPATSVRVRDTADPDYRHCVIEVGGLFTKAAVVDRLSRAVSLPREGSG